MAKMRGETPIERGDVRSVMLSLMDLPGKADHIIELLEDDEEPDEGAEANR
jgi:hypothetical protein